MSERLDRELEEHFKGVPDSTLIRTIENAEPFEGDDEIYELSRRLRLVGKAWKYAQKYGREVVVIYTPDFKQSVDFEDEAEYELNRRLLEEDDGSDNVIPGYD